MATRADVPAEVERAAFFDALYGAGEGLTYVVAGLPGDDIAARGWPLGPGESPDPDRIYLLSWTRDTFDAFKAAGRPHTGRVFAWPRQRQALERYITAQDAEGFNVYVRKYLAPTERAARYGEAPATADRVVVEDAPEDPAGLAPAYSFTLQTSDYSRHAVYQLDRALPWAQVKALAEAAGDRLHADSGGANPAQFTRVPGTRNTKRKAARFLVRYTPGAGVVAVAELAHAVGVNLSGCAAHQRAERLEVVIDPATPAEVARGNLLLNSARWRTMIERRPQLRALLIDGQRIVLPTKHGPRDSGSEQVAVFVVNCRTNLPAPPPDDEILCVALALRDVLRPGAELDAYKRDVLRILADTRYTAIRPAQATQHLPGAPAAAHEPLEPAQHALVRRTRGRPVGDRDRRMAKLLRLLRELPADDQGRRSYRIDDLAAELGCSRRTVSSLLAELAGPEHRAFTKGQHGGRGGLPYVVIFWDADKSPAGAVEVAGERAFWDASRSPAEGSSTPQTAIENQWPNRKNTPPPSAALSPGATASATTGPAAATLAASVTAGVTPCAPAVTIAAAVAEALEALAPLYSRVTWQRVRSYVAGVYPGLRFTDRQVRGLLDRERKRRTWARQVEALRTMPYGKLAALGRRVEREIEAHSQGLTTRRYAWAAALVSHVHAELDRRAEMGADVKRNRARQRAAEQAAFWALEALREAQPALRAGGRVCSPPSAPIERDAPADAPGAPSDAPGTPRARSLIANLRALTTR